MPIDRSQTYLDRWTEVGVDEFLASMCADDGVRLKATRRVADTILAAHSLNPRVWGLTMKSWGCRLNFGRVEAISWTSSSIGIMVDFESIAIKSSRTRLESLVRSTGYYEKAPNSRYVWLDTSKTGTFDALLALANAPHLAHLELVARTGINGATRIGHHPGLVEAIGRVAGKALPQPAYVTVTRPIAPSALAGSSVAPVAEATYAPSQVYEEGQSRDVIQTVVERNAAARHDCIAHYGARCVVCELSLDERYGDVARDLIHVHHLQPVGASDGPRLIDPIAGLRPVCPNCHAVIHRREPPYSINEVQAMLRG